MLDVKNSEEREFVKSVLWHIQTVHDEAAKVLESPTLLIWELDDFLEYLRGGAIDGIEKLIAAVKYPCSGQYDIPVGLVDEIIKEQKEMEGGDAPC